MQTAMTSLLPVAEQVVLDRRHLHAHPELGFQEIETAPVCRVDVKNIVMSFHYTAGHKNPYSLILVIIFRAKVFIAKIP